MSSSNHVTIPHVNSVRRPKLIRPCHKVFECINDDASKTRLLFIPLAREAASLPDLCRPTVVICSEPLPILL